MDVYKKLSFHESTVDQFSMSGDIFLIHLLDVKCSGKKLDVKIEISEIKEIFVDSSLSDIPIMLEEDAEVLQLNILGDELKLLVEWNNFFKKTSDTKSYRFIAKKIAIEVIE